MKKIISIILITGALNALALDPTNTVSFSINTVPGANYGGTPIRPAAVWQPHGEWNTTDSSNTLAAGETTMVSIVGDIGYLWIGLAECAQASISTNFVIGGVSHHVIDPEVQYEGTATGVLSWVTNAAQTVWQNQQYNDTIEEQLEMRTFYNANASWWKDFKKGLLKEDEIKAPTGQPRPYRLKALPSATFTLSTASALDGPYTYAQSVTTDWMGETLATNTAANLLTFERAVCTNNGYAGGTNYSTNVSAWLSYAWPTGKTAFTCPLVWRSYSITNALRWFPTNIAVIATATGKTGFSTNWNTASGWTDPGMEILPGAGYFLLNTNAAFTNGFAGDVDDRSSVNRDWGNSAGSYAFTGAVFPRAGYLQQLGFVPGSDSVSVELWNGTAWEESFFDGSVWSPLASFTVDDWDGPWIGVGQPFVIHRHHNDDPSWAETLTP